MTDSYSGSPYSRSSHRIGSDRRGFQTTDLMGAVIVLLIFLLVFVGAYAAAMEKQAAAYEARIDAAIDCMGASTTATAAEERALNALMDSSFTCK